MLKIFPPNDCPDTRTPLQQLLDAIEYNVRNMITPYMAPKEVQFLVDDIMRSLRYDTTIRNLLNESSSKQPTAEHSDM